MKVSICILTLMFALALTSYGQNDPFKVENEVRVYPNPAKETIQVTINHMTLEHPEITLHTIIGNKVQVEAEKISENSYKFSIDNLPDGYYLVVIRENEFRKAFKFLKN